MLKFDNKQITLFVSALVMVAIVSVALLAVTRSMIDDAAQTIAVIDMDSIIEERQSIIRSRLQKYAGKDAAKFKSVREEAMRDSIEFATRLNIAVEQIAKECNCIVIRGDMVLAGSAIDMTQRVKNIALGKTDVASN